MIGPTIFDWMLMVPDVALWLSMIMSFVAILMHPFAADRYRLWGMGRLAIYVCQVILSAIGLLVLNMVN